jgi:hypothetical protein
MLSTNKSWFWYLMTILAIGLLVWIIYDTVSPKQQNILVEILGSLLTTFFASIILLFKLFPNQGEEEKKIQNSVNIGFNEIKNSTNIGFNEIKENLPGYLKLRNSGLIDLSEDFPNKLFENDLSKSKEVFILQTWIPNIGNFEKPIIDCAKSGGKITILLLNPESKFTIHRSNAIGYDSSDYVKEQIKSNIKDIVRFSNIHNIANNLTIMLYDEIPIMSLHISDNLCIIGWYWKGKLSNLGNHLIIDNKSGSFRDFEAHFNKIKDISINLDLNAMSK